MSMISVIVPCFNEEAGLPYFFPEIRKLANKMFANYGILFEILFIDDGSEDKTLELLRELAVEDDRVHYIAFSRNFGKEAAIYAGMQNISGDYVVLMDADLQHPPAMVEEMYKALENGDYDIAAARRVSRKGEPPIRSFFASCFYWLINRISKAEFVDGASDYRMLSYRAINAVLTMAEYNRFSKGIFGWIGFKTKWLEYENVKRVAGETKWSFWTLFLYSLEGLVAFSTVPLAIASVMGILFCLVALTWMMVIIVKTLIWGDPVAGYPTLACLLLLIGGSIQLSLGIIGQYLAKTYLETKDRPVYIVKETNKELSNEEKTN